MGTVVTYDAHPAASTSTRLGGWSRCCASTDYCGYINLNTIVNERGIWPLEFTCRFGYPGFAILSPLQVTAWGELLAAMADQSCSTFDVRPGFSVGIVLTTPPFPYARPHVQEPVGLPVLFEGELSRRSADICIIARSGSSTVSS